MFRLLFAFMILLCATAAHTTEAGWVLLRDGGHIVLLRHAMIGGASESANFDIGKCATQRNLSERGKQQARKIGALFAARAAPVERIQSSRYCRCLDTARIAFEAEPEPFDALDLLSTDETTKKSQLDAVMSEIRNFSGSDNLIMVTHAENIQALAGISPREGEAVIVRPDGEGLHVLGRIIFN